MPGKTIDQLTTASSLTGVEEVPLWQSSTTNKATLSVLATYFSSVLSPVLAYLAPYTGAVARTFNAKVSDQLSVKDFGAKGDGVFAGTGTDDTVAIQAAITACASRSTGGTVFFPSGIYITTSAINVPDKVNLEGEKTGWTNNAGSAWLSGAAIYKKHTGNGVTVTSGNVGTRVVDLAILSNNVTYAAGHGFFLGPCVDCRLERCNVFKVGGDSFVLGDNTANSYLNAAVDCYSNNPLARNFVVASKWFKGAGLISDGGTIGTLVQSTASEFSVQDLHHEGVSTAGIQFNGGGQGEIFGHNTLVMSGAGIIGIDVLNVNGSQLIDLRGFHINGLANAAGSRGLRLNGSNNVEISFFESTVENAERGVETISGPRFVVEKCVFNACSRAFKVAADYFKFVFNDITATVDAQVGDFSTGVNGNYSFNNLDKILVASGSGCTAIGKILNDDSNIAIGNQGWLTKNTFTTTSTTSPIVIAHGLPLQPSEILVLPDGPPAGLWYAASDATNVTITWAGGGSLQFFVQAHLACRRQA